MDCHCIDKARRQMRGVSFLLTPCAEWRPKGRNMRQCRGELQPPHSQPREIPACSPVADGRPHNSSRKIVKWLKILLSINLFVTWGKKVLTQIFIALSPFWKLQEKNSVVCNPRNSKFEIVLWRKRIILDYWWGWGGRMDDSLIKTVKRQYFKSKVFKKMLIAYFQLQSC